ncbi:CAP domain-containing protein [Methylocaldum sp.]|uniref:CAP domain-containing protein n=1 Tax=Methylocaldum sp. TaxID=1969727 RepID=UPI002D5413F8|nr:CAP domain-containing protein [Methylocaldum sp.]HYE36000.1 CAP domain-containing protein [Methylocaldum sp.]
MTRLVLSLALSVGLAFPTFAREAPSAAGCPSVDTIKREIVDELKAVRAEPRYCGRKRSGSAKPLRWNQKLFKAAEKHAKEMSRNDRLSHKSRDGRKAGDRITQAGYTWQAYGENIAEGQRTVGEVLRSWLDSPEHCSNIMEKDFDEIGVACSVSGGGSPYWVMVLAAPLSNPAASLFSGLV